MIRPIMKNETFLKQKLSSATPADAPIITDLIDTLKAHTDHCVGMAANMIGVKKCIIVFSVGPFVVPMVNPVITRKSDPFEAEEGCLSLEGVRKTTRYEIIEVSYQDQNFVRKKEVFQGWTAQIIQHEIDHCNGILI